MLRLATIFILIAVAVARTPRVRPSVPMYDGRIAGGKATTIEEFPHELSLQFLGSHSCGASIISLNKALTAAHCTDGASPSYLTVRAGSSKLGSGGIVSAVSSICQHPKYDARFMDYDVSVLRLRSSLPTGASIRSISIARLYAYPTIGANVTVTGWGTSVAGNPLSSQLQKVQLSRVSDQDCELAYGVGAITNRMLCFNTEEGGKGACLGDSGGPLIANGTQFGVVSWGYVCASRTFPGVYANIAFDAIRNHIVSC